MSTVGIANQDKNLEHFPIQVRKSVEAIKKDFETTSSNSSIFSWFFPSSSKRSFEFTEEVGNYWDHVVEYDWNPSKPPGTSLSDSFALACKISGITETPFKQIFVDNKGGGGLTTWFTLEKGYVDEKYQQKMQSGEYNNPETLFIAGRNIGEDAEKQISDETKRMYGGQLKNAVVVILTTEETSAIKNLRLPERIQNLLRNGAK